MNRRRYWVMPVLVALCLAAWTACTYAAETKVVESTAESPDALISQDIGNTWPVTIDPATGETTCESGEDITMAEALDISEKKAESLTGDKQELVDFLEDQEIYGVAEKDGEIRVSFPFAYRQLIVLADEGSLKDTHGAINSVYCRLTGFYILQYADEQSTKSALEALRKELGADRVMEDLPIHPALYKQTECNLTSASSVSWGSDKMRLDTLRDKTNAGSITRRVTVAVLDSGINRTHELFAGRKILPQSTTFEGQTGSAGYVYYDDTINAPYGAGHGTHVAGTIADGTSRQIQFLIVKVFDNNGSGSTSTLLQGLEYAYSQGVDIMSHSGGSILAEVTSETVLSTLRSYLKKYWDGGTLLVCAAGNDGMLLDEEKVFPAFMPYNISVSAMVHDDWDDQNGGLAVQSFTNFGKQIDFTGPGVEIMSSGITSNTNYQVMSGTSMATPHISAAAAMMKLYNPKATPAEIYQLLRAISFHPGSNIKGAVPDVYLGYGLPVFDRGVPRLLRTQKISLSKSLYVYNGKARKPAVKVKNGSTTLRKGTDYTVSYSNNKKLGIAKVKITGKGLYVGTVTKKFTIGPRGTSLKKVAAGKKSLAIRWKKQSAKTSGYQIQLAANSKFTKGKKLITVSGASKTKTTVKNLKKGKTYYIRIRTYKKVSGKKICSAWSKVKKQKTR